MMEILKILIAGICVYYVGFCIGLAVCVKFDIRVTSVRALIAHFLCLTLALLFITL